jgi:hypothetical protein
VQDHPRRGGISLKGAPVRSNLLILTEASRVWGRQRSGSTASCPRGSRFAVAQDAQRDDPGLANDPESGECRSIPYQKLTDIRHGLDATRNVRPAGRQERSKREREMRYILCATFAIVGLSSATQVFAASPGNCQEYSHSAVKDFEQATASSNAKKCKITPNARWQSNFQNHYNWCLTAPTASLRSEKGARRSSSCLRGKIHILSDLIAPRLAPPSSPSVAWRGIVNLTGCGQRDAHREGACATVPIVWTASGEE